MRQHIDVGALEWLKGRRSCDNCRHSCTSFYDPDPGANVSGSLEDWSCELDDDPRMPFTVDEGHPCPLWEAIV